MTRYGLLLPSRESVLWGDADPQPLIDLAVAAERAGFDSLWVGDSIVARPRFEPLVLLAAVAAVTSRATLGTAVYLPLLRHPTVAAHAISTLDRLSGGRLIVGVGAGASVPATDEELVAVGVEPGQRVTRLLETTDQWRRTWSGDGPARIEPAPATAGGPPLWLAGGGPRMLRLAGARFDGWLPYSPTPHDFGAGLEQVRVAARSANRDLSTFAAGVYITVALEEAAPDAEDELDQFMLGYYGLPLELMGRVQACHHGTVDSAAAFIRSYEDKGATDVVIRLAHRDLSVHGDLAARLVDVLRRL